MKLFLYQAIASNFSLISTSCQSFRNPRILFAVSLVLGVTTACSSSQPTPTNLSLKLEPTGRPGVYLASGETNLPDRSRLAISGIRYLQPTTTATIIRPDNANYAILDREIAEVYQGKWQTTLTLWQIAPNGSYQESWQRQQRNFGLSYNASGQVVFAATFEPDNQLSTINQQVSNNSFRPPLLRFTPSGQAYLQASQTLSVSLPTGKTTPPSVSANDLNNGWGNKSSLKPQPSTNTVIAAPPKEKLNDAPLPSSAFMR